MSYVGVDLGTTGCRCVVFGRNGGILSQSYIEYGLICNGSHIEQDAELWWALVKHAVATCAAACPDAGKIEAMSVSSQGVSFVPLDESGCALQNAVSWPDNRASSQAERLKSKFGERSILLRVGKRHRRATPCRSFCGSERRCRMSTATPGNF